MPSTTMPSVVWKAATFKWGMWRGFLQKSPLTLKRRGDISSSSGLSDRGGVRPWFNAEPPSATLAQH